MVATFNYNQSDEAIFNDIVDGSIESLHLYSEGVKDRKSYDELQKDISSNVAKYLTEGTRYAAKFDECGSEVLRNPNVTRNKDIREKFNAVIAEIINSAIPTTVSHRFGEEFMEVRQIGWGDTARFLISSNELFQVNEIAEGILRGVLQPIFNDEITVNASPIEIATSIDWYQVAAGNFDWGQFGFRAGRSFEGYILLKGMAAMASGTFNAGAEWGQAGFSETTWTELAQMVSSANGGQDVYALGTLTALAQVYPSVTGLQYGLGKEIVDRGHLDRFLGVKLVPIDNFILPGRVNTTGTLGLPNNKIYMIAADQYKPIKVIMEGDSVAVEWIPTETTDKTYRVRVQMRIGVASVLGSRYAEITLPSVTMAPVPSAK